MFLTDKYSSLLPLHSKAHRHQQRQPRKPLPAGAAGSTAAARFEAALAARLRSLLPLPAASSSPLAALARLTDLLALTLRDAAPALATSAGDDAAAAVAAHLDAGVALLDAYNAIAAHLDGLRRRRLLARFALHLLSSSSPSSVERARAALADRDDPAASSPPPPLHSIPFDQPRGGGRLSAAARVLVAVNAVSSLAASAAAAVLNAGGGHTVISAFPLVSGGDFPWAGPFNAVSRQLSTLAAANAGEVHTLDEAVRKLASALDGGEGGRVVDEAAREVETRTEELTARLDRLSDAVNGVFRAALCLRNNELGSLTVGPADKTRK